MANNNRYQRAKENARQTAKDWQYMLDKRSLSWWDVADWGDYFEKLARRYGLVREFRENGII